MGEVGEGNGTLTFYGATHRAVVYDLAMNMICDGFNKIVFVSHHGSSSKVIDDVLRRIRYKMRQAVLPVGIRRLRNAVIRFWGISLKVPPEETPRWHADENETSTVMAWDESLIDMQKTAKDTIRAQGWMGDEFSKRDGSGTVAFMQYPGNTAIFIV